MGAADGVDARARRVAARLLPTRARRSAAGARGGDAQGSDPAGARHRPQPVDPASIARAVRALEQDGWVLLSQVQRPGGSRLVIDHIAIGPGGVVVIDSRHWVGRIEVTRGVVQQNGFWREQECAAVARTAGAVAALLPPRHRTAVHAVICVVQHDLAEHLVPPGVHVVGVNELGRALRALPYRLPPAEVTHLHVTLGRLLRDAGTPDQLTTAELEERPGSGRPGAHREPVDPVTPTVLFVPIAGRALRDVARGAPRRRGPRRRPARERSPWGPVARWGDPATLAPASRRRSSRPLMLARLLLAGLLVVALLVIGPALLRGVVDQPGPTAPMPVGSLVVPGVVPGPPDASRVPGDLDSGPDRSGPDRSGPDRAGPSPSAGLRSPSAVTSAVPVPAASPTS